MKLGNLASVLACILMAGCSTIFGGKTTLSQQPASGPEVAIADGTLQGVSDGSVQYFKGIPYAAPPVGDLRWEPPQPVAPWTGVHDASRFVHDCMQQPFPFDAAPLSASLSEDCLYVNVWRPANAAAGAKLPVMVWIHGGGFVNGGSSSPVYDGTHFADKGVIFVSMNYRLGRFGFFGFPALTAEHPDDPHGNYGYMDQIAALKWVRSNIAAFGGDPDNVFVFGESAGGGSVHMLLSSPMAKGLFAKAGVESGGGRGELMGPRQLSKDQPGLPSLETIGVNFAKTNGIDGNGADALAKLRALPADKIVAGLGMMSMMQASGPPTYGGPIEDGKVVTQSPEAAYKSGDFAHVPLLIGANSADIGFGTARTADEALTQAFDGDAKTARADYAATTDGSDREIMYSIAMDKMMVEPARFGAQEFSAAGLPAYEYRFSYVSPEAEAAFKASPFANFGMDGAQHASEIPYAFDTIRAAQKGQATPEDEATAQSMNAYWVDFAKAGNPNGDALPQWPAYGATSDTLMNFTQTGPKAMTDPWAARLDLVAKHADDKPPLPPGS